MAADFSQVSRFAPINNVQRMYSGKPEPVAG